MQQLEDEAQTVDQAPTRTKGHALVRTRRQYGAIPSEILAYEAGEFVCWLEQLVNDGVALQVQCEGEPTPNCPFSKLAVQAGGRRVGQLQSPVQLQLVSRGLVALSCRTVQRTAKSTKIIVTVNLTKRCFQNISISLSTQIIKLLDTFKDRPYAKPIDLIQPQKASKQTGISIQKLFQSVAVEKERLLQTLYQKMKQSRVSAEQQLVNRQGKPIFINRVNRKINLARSQRQSQVNGMILAIDQDCYDPKYIISDILKEQATIPKHSKQGGTLVVVPPQDLGRWVSGSDLLLYAQRQRYSNQSIAVITDYKTLQTQYSLNYHKRSQGLYSYNWIRLVLVKADILRHCCQPLVHSVLGVKAQQKIIVLDPKGVRRAEHLFPLLVCLGADPWKRKQIYIQQACSSNQFCGKLLQQVFEQLFLYLTYNHSEYAQKIVNLKPQLLKANVKLKWSKKTAIKFFLQFVEKRFSELQIQFVEEAGLKRKLLARGSAKEKAIEQMAERFRKQDLHCACCFKEEAVQPCISICAHFGCRGCFATTVKENSKCCCCKMVLCQNDLLQVPVKIQLAENGYFQKVCEYIDGLKSQATVLVDSWSLGECLASRIKTEVQSIQKKVNPRQSKGRVLVTVGVGDCAQRARLLRAMSCRAGAVELHIL